MRLFSTEQVSRYHPDKYADQISDAILTECLKQDKTSHVACEALVKDKKVIIAGEIKTRARIDYEAIVRRVAKKLNYEVEEVINLIGEQSPEINEAVGDSIAAGDQGIMFGYATSETASYLPFAFDLANTIIERIEIDVLQEGSPLKGDAKTQVTVDLDTNRIITAVVSVCHHEQYTLEYIQDYIKSLLWDIVEPEKLLINPAGAWTIGGPEADCGLTGRKIVCDQYGGYCAVGGGAFSGKDPSKVDRSATYMARRIAKDIVQTFKEKDCSVQLAYAIGQAAPVSVSAIGATGNDYSPWVIGRYDLTPAGIIRHLDLYGIAYDQLAEGCHFRDETI